jgi:hypothetical protein
VAWKINDNTYGDFENLRVTYNMNEGTCIIRGVRYKYINVGWMDKSIENVLRIYNFYELKAI